MEHRYDLEDLLLDGLPEQERRHTERVIEQVTARKLQRLKAQGVRDNHPIELIDFDEADDDSVPS